MKTIQRLVAIAAFSFVAASPAALATQPIQNITDAPIASTKPLTAAQVKQAITVAGVGLGWQIAEDGPGKLKGTLNLRKHTAIVEIPYSAKKYSIIYQSSVNLDEKNGEIHRNYNSWVRNFEKAINAAIAAQ